MRLVIEWKRVEGRPIVTNNEISIKLHGLSRTSKGILIILVYLGKVKA